MTATMFMELPPLVYKEETSFVCGHLCCSTARYIISVEHKLCASSTKVHKHHAFQQNCQFQFLYIWNNQLATHIIFGSDELCDDNVRSNSKRKK
jgi:hypothetical protein